MGWKCDECNTQNYDNNFCNGCARPASYLSGTAFYTHHLFAAQVVSEIKRAQTKFPSSRCSTVALMEEVGELAQAMLKVAAGKWTIEKVREEAIQVACMAYRVGVEGDSSISFYSEPDEMKNNQ